MNKAIITLSSITYAIKCRKLLSKKGIRSKLVKLDSSKNVSGCNYGIELANNDFYSAVVILRSEGINYGIFKDN